MYGHLDFNGAPYTYEHTLGMILYIVHWDMCIVGKNNLLRNSDRKQTDLCSSHELDKPPDGQDKRYLLNNSSH